jgi:inhibitor of KinA
MQSPRFLDAGEAALIVEFGTCVDPLINDCVVALDEDLTSLALPGVIETVPTYRSLLIHYDPLVIKREDLIAAINAIEARPVSARKPKKLWAIPCCYEPPFSEDLGQVATHLGMDETRLVQLHSETTFRVYMYGFAPGFCYLGGLPKELNISRRAMPRGAHDSNAILMAGGLCLVSTFPMPTGWWVIGRTPVRMYLPSRQPSFLMEVGDLVRFLPVSANQFDSMERRALSGETVAGHQRLP